MSGASPLLTHSNCHLVSTAIGSQHRTQKRHESSRDGLGSHSASVADRGRAVAFAFLCTTGLGAFIRVQTKGTLVLSAAFGSTITEQ